MIYTTYPFNRTTAATLITQTFDANGNTVTRSVGGTNWTFSWDRENRVTNVSSASASVDYVYDALGRRVSRSDGSDTTEFTHDGEDVVLDDSTASGITKYHNGPGIDNKLSVEQGSTTSYILADHLGSTNALTDSTGAITASNSYDSFGNSSNGSFPTRYEFTGREFDSTTGLQFSRARFYDPKLGRFVSEDPIGFVGGDINIYSYVNNRPTALRDPTGTHGTMGAATAAAFLIVASASPVNAPSQCDPVYFPDNPLLLNAAGGQALGMAGGYLFNRFITPYLGRLLAGMGDDIITLGLPPGPATAPPTPPLQPIPVAPPAGPGVYRALTTGDDYIGQSATLATRTNGHYSPKGKLSQYGRRGEEYFEMPGSTRLEREVYEQYLINKAGGVDNLINIRNPMGGRMDRYHSMYRNVIREYGLPW